MARADRFLQMALEAIDVNDGLNAHLAAVIVRGGSVLSIATNTLGLNTFVYHHAPHAGVRSIHAEINAVFKVRRKVDLEDSVMYVARRTYHGDVALAKPCPMCVYVLQRYGIKRVYYTVNRDMHVVMNVPKIEVKRRKR